MKKLSFLFAVLLMASVPFFTSCGTDGETDPPTLMLNAGTGYTSTDVSVPVNTELKVGVITAKGSAKLTNLKITQSGESTALVDTTISADNFNIDYLISAPSTVGVFTWTFRITDANGESAEASFKVTTTPAPINTYTAVLMGGQLNPDLGSFYSTGTNTVLKIGAATAAPASVDFGFYYGEVNLATISAPADPAMAGVTNFDAISGWNPKNATKMKRILTTVDWATVTDDAAIVSLATDLSSTMVNKLVKDYVVAFETASTSTNPGKKGLFKVIELNGTSAGTDRSIKIEVKIQK
jgi:hypothetical protein